MTANERKLIKEAIRYPFPTKYTTYVGTNKYNVVVGGCVYWDGSNYYVNLTSFVLTERDAFCAGATLSRLDCRTRLLHEDWGSNWLTLYGKEYTTLDKIITAIKNGTFSFVNINELLGVKRVSHTVANAYIKRSIMYTIVNKMQDLNVCFVSAGDLTYGGISTIMKLFMASKGRLGLKVTGSAVKTNPNTHERVRDYLGELINGFYFPYSPSNKEWQRGYDSLFKTSLNIYSSHGIPLELMET